MSPCLLRFRKWLLPTTLVIIFWHFTVCQYKFDSEQVKRELISSITNFVYELPCQWNKIKILRNQEILERWWHNLVSSLSSKNEILATAVKNCTKKDIKVFALVQLSLICLTLPNVLSSVVVTKKCGLSSNFRFALLWDTFTIKLDAFRKMSNAWIILHNSKFLLKLVTEFQRLPRDPRGT